MSKYVKEHDPKGMLLRAARKLEKKKGLKKIKKAARKSDGSDDEGDDDYVPRIRLKRK